VSTRVSGLVGLLGWFWERPVGIFMDCSLEFMGVEGEARLCTELHIASIGVMIVAIVIVAFFMHMKSGWNPGISARVCCCLLAFSVCKRDGS